MKIVVYTLAIVVLLIGGCASHESSFRIGYDFSTVDKVAVVAIEGTLRSEVAKNQIADFFAMEFLKKGYAPVERAQVNALLKEQELQSTDLTTAEGAAEAGQVLNIPVVLIVNIPHFGEEISMTAKMMDVEDGIILWMGRSTGKGGRSWTSIFRIFSGEDTGIGVSSADGELLGSVVGDVLGGVSGQALSIHEAKKAQHIVKRICKSLPSRSESEW